MSSDGVILQLVVPRPSREGIIRRKRRLLVAVVPFLGLNSTVSSAGPTIANSAVIAIRAEQTALDEAAFRAFNDAIVEYVRLQRRLRGEVPGLVVTTEPRNISNASDTLAAAIQRARRAAKKGDIFDKAATSAIAGRLRVGLQGVDIATFVNGINDESTFRDSRGFICGFLTPRRWRRCRRPFSKSCRRCQPSWSTASLDGT